MSSAQSTLTAARSATAEPPRQTAAFYLSVLVATVTLIMLTAGGLVTTLDAGDAEPAWSLRFWEWFRHPGELPGGLFYEMSHRMIGTVVGFLTIALAAVLWRTEGRRWVKWLGAVALLAVIGQGLLGGLRVLVVSDPGVQNAVLEATGGGDDVSLRRAAIGILHGVSGQTVFGLMIAIVLVTSWGWRHPRQSGPPALAKRLRRLAVTTTAIVYVQTVIGAVTRHAPTSFGTHLHMGWAAVVIVHVLLLALRAQRLEPEAFPVRQPASLLVFIVIMQVFLGFGSWMFTLPGTSVSPPQALVVLTRTGHVATGAMILAICVVVTLRSYRLLATNSAGLAARTVPGQEGAA